MRERRKDRKGKRERERERVDGMPINRVWTALD